MYYGVILCSLCQNLSVILATVDGNNPPVYNGTKGEVVACFVCNYPNDWPADDDPRPDPEPTQ